MKIDKNLFRKYQPYAPAQVRGALAKVSNGLGPASSWARRKSIRIGKGPGWVFFADVTGKRGRTIFPERIDADGIYTWVSLASQGPKHPVIMSFAAHDEKAADILLFARGLTRGPYYYLGKLKFTALEPGRHRPVRINWRILDFAPSPADLSRMKIVLDPGERETAGKKVARASRVLEGPGVSRTMRVVKAQKRLGAAKLIRARMTARAGKSAQAAKKMLEPLDVETRAVFAGLGSGRVARAQELKRKPLPWGMAESSTEVDLGTIAAGLEREPGPPAAEKWRMELAGESLVIEYERRMLEKAGRRDLADKVTQALESAGSHPGYDVLSFDPETGAEIPISVKTTAGDARTPFFLSTAELDCIERARGKYRVYRIYGFDFFKERVEFFLMDMPILVWGAAVYSG